MDSSVFIILPMVARSKALRLYSRKCPGTIFFSTWVITPFVYEDKRWPTVDHFYHAMKFPRDEKTQERIRNAQHAWEAKAIAIENEEDMREDWNEVKEQVMFMGCMAKFQQNEPLRKRLIRSTERKIINNSTYDNYWGTGLDGSGKNRLGPVLERVRRLLVLYADV